MKTEFKIINNVKCYAPEVAYENTDYNESSFRELFELEDRNFWFKSRNNVIQNLFEKYAKNSDGNFLEIGCGTGYVLTGLKNRFPELKVTGAEIYLEGLKFAKKRLPEIEFIQMDATNIPFEEEYDNIGAFDVLEHISEDEKVINNVFKSLTWGGKFFISVPQYMWMWSNEDDYACHKRRYAKKEIIYKLEKAGFLVRYITSFVFTLFPLMSLSRLIIKNTKNDESSRKETNSELKLNPILNKIFEQFMKLDEFLISIGAKLPFGGSLIVVAEKNRSIV